MSEKQPKFPLSYESDGMMGKPEKKQPSSTAKNENKDFFNTTQASE
ncbi:hypothetical protein [Anoxybacteroides tepidamans]|nr:hypothetical protein [Anoxybacillus tepidamans]